jgi:prevent-host-death family protein
MKAKTVGARELKTRLGAYLRQVREGKTLIVTDRGEPIAELRPIPSQSSGEEAILEKLASLGIVTHLNKSPLTHFHPVTSTGPPVADAVVEGREDRL